MTFHFLVSDYLAAEQVRRKELGLDLLQADDVESSLWSTSNLSLAQNGSQIVKGTLTRYFCDLLNSFKLN